MSKRSFDFAELPKEGTWFIRWIDGFARHAPSLSNPQIEVAFERLPGDVWRGVTFADAIAKNEPRRRGSRRPMPAETRRFHAGALAGFYLGAVIQDGKQIPERLKAPIIEFSFDLPRDLLVKSGREDDLGLMPASTAVGELLGTADPASLVPHDTYRTLITPHLVTALKSEQGLLIIPSSVMIRAFLSPVGAVIRDLVRRPPQKVKRPGPLLHQVLGPETGLTADERWRVALDDKIAERHAPLIGNLHEALNPHGYRAAERVHEGVRSTPSQLAGALPFTDCILQMSVAVYHLAPDRMLALDVTRVRWPYPNQRSIEVLRWTPERDPEDAVDYRPGGRPGLATEGDIEVSSMEDADERADLVLWEIAGAEWDALPERRERRQAFNVDGPHTVGLKDGSPDAEASMGGPGRQPGVHAVSPDQRPEQPRQVEDIDRFEKILAMLDELARLERNNPGTGIEAWSPNAPSKSEYKLTAGTRLVWRFQEEPEDHSDWVWFNPDQAARRCRAALVCRFTVPGYGVATWFDIEGRRDKDVYRALIAPWDLSEAEIIRLLNEVRAEQNVVGVKFSAVFPARPSPVLWKHMRKKGTDRLHVGSALRSIRSAFGR